MWGYSEVEIVQFGLIFGVGVFMFYMVFIILQFVWELKVGCFGIFVLLLGLGFGFVGFVVKGVIKFFFVGNIG